MYKHKHPNGVQKRVKENKRKQDGEGDRTSTLQSKRGARQVRVHGEVEEGMEENLHEPNSEW